MLVVFGVAGHVLLHDVVGVGVHGVATSSSREILLLLLAHALHALTVLTTAVYCIDVVVVWSTYTVYIMQRVTAILLLVLCM